MAIFRCYTTQEVLKRSIDDFAKVTNTEIEGDLGSGVILRSKSVIFKIAVRLSRIDSIDISVESEFNITGKTLVTLSLALSLYSLCRAFYELHYNEHLLNAGSYVAFMTLPALIFFFFVIRKNETHVKRTIRKLIAEIRGSCRVDQLSPPFDISISRTFDFFTQLSIGILVGSLCYSLLGNIVLLLLAPIGLMLISEVLWLCCNPNSWVCRYMIHFEAARSTGCLILVLWIQIALAIGAMQHAKSEDKIPRYITSYEQGLMGEWIISGVEQYRTESKTIASTVFTNYTFDNVSLNSVAIFHLSYVAMLIPVFLFQSWARDSWWSSYLLGSKLEIPPGAPPSSSVIIWTETIGLALTSIVRGSIYWLVLLITIDVTAFIFLDTSIFLDSVGFAMTMMQISLANATVLDRISLPVKALFLPMLMPGMLILGSVVIRFAALCVAPIGNFLDSKVNRRRPVWSEEARKTLENMRLPDGVRPPRLRVLKSCQPLIFVQDGFFGFGRRVMISARCHELLTIKEIEALVLHEVHHLAHDVKWIRLSRIISLLLLHPINYIALAYQFDRRELAADAFAATSMRDAKPLISALVKLSTSKFEISRGRVLGSLLRFIRPFRGLFSKPRERITGASYPHLHDRLAALKNMEFNP